MGGVVCKFSRTYLVDKRLLWPMQALFNVHWAVIVLFAEAVHPINVVLHILPASTDALFSNILTILNRPSFVNWAHSTMQLPRAVQRSTSLVRKKLRRIVWHIAVVDRGQSSCQGRLFIGAALFYIAGRCLVVLLLHVVEFVLVPHG